MTSPRERSRGHGIHGTRASCYTGFVRNVTITLDDDTARWTRVEAAKADQSVSKWIGQILDERRRQSHDYEAAREAYASRAAVALKPTTDRYPTRDELHDR